VVPLATGLAIVAVIILVLEVKYFAKQRTLEACDHEVQGRLLNLAYAQCLPQTIHH
jgi:hypothetical protein